MINLGYDAAGKLLRIDFPNQVASELTYDLDGRLEQIAHTRGPTELTSLAYDQGSEGKINSIAEPGGTRTFTYDAFQQVTSGGFVAAPETYEYDAEGNRLTSHLSTGHNHDAANRLIADDAFTYNYDANGNLVGKTDQATGVVTTYTWNVRNQLARIDFPDLTSASYRYDALSRRIEKEANGVITRYIYDDDDDIVLEYDGNNNLRARYGHGLEVDQPLVQERDGQNYYYHFDHLGSIRKLTDAAGAVVNSYDMDSFGRFETRIESVPNPYTFTAREFDAESGLHFYRARYYDPDVGRFISEDPIGFRGGDSNLYRYVINSPVNAVDPRGTGPTGEYLAAAGWAMGFKILTLVSAQGFAVLATPEGLCEVALSGAGAALVLKPLITIKQVSNVFGKLFSFLEVKLRLSTAQLAGAAGAVGAGFSQRICSVGFRWVAGIPDTIIIPPLDPPLSDPNAAP